MNFRIIRVVCILIVFGFGVLLFTNYSKQSQNYETLEYGVLDKIGTFDNESKITINHTFAVWSKEDTASIDEAMASIASTVDRDLLITVEPWPQFEETGEEMFQGIIGGRYDEIIQDTCIKLQSLSSGQEVYLRIGHEMDLFETSRYPWATNDTEGFKSAYRYLISMCRQFSEDVSFVWSPAGKENAENYYPGDDWVDYTSISFFGYPENELREVNDTFNFAELFNPKYQRVQKYNKPIFISETAVSADDGYQREWLQNAKETIENREKYPLLKAFVYFNAKDNIRWSPELEEPDFTIPEFYYPF